MKTLLLFLMSVGTLSWGAGEPLRMTVVESTPEHPRNDSATVVQLKDGRLFMVWMEFIGGAKQGNDEAPNHLMSMISADGGRTWGNRRVIRETGPQEVSVYNPALFRLKNGDIRLFYIAYVGVLVGQSPIRTDGFITDVSADAATFGEPRRLWSHERYLCANDTVIRLKDGRLVRGMCRAVDTWAGPSESGTLISDDEGLTWTPSATWFTLPLRGTMESHVAETPDGSILMAVRNDLGAVFFSRSSDRGVHWSPPQSSGLSAPQSMPVLTRMPSSGDLLLVWNHSTYLPDYGHRGKRTPLTCAVSNDGGRTWDHIKDLETDPEYEFSNPACDYFSEGKVIITYFSSKMVSSEPPGKFGRAKMDLREIVADESWFHQ